VELEICFTGPYMASASGPSRIRDTFLYKKKTLNKEFINMVYNLDKKSYHISWFGGPGRIGIE
jgi:hypothetical protein